jgi:hypothetical protein
VRICQLPSVRARSRNLIAAGAVACSLFCFGVQAQTTAAGKVPDQFTVLPNGSASYRIPIQAPPGVAGLEPKLELAYSGRGQGLMGLGWSLSGLSAITRCPRTIAQDGVHGAVKLNDNDRYCLDGQRLIAISGVYGQAGTEYRTELDTFSKIISNGRAGSGASSFTVRTKAGQILEYGNTADSKIEAVAATGTTAPWSAGTVREWAVSKVSDLAGNYITVSYDEDTVNGVYRPNRIDYGGNTTAGTAPQSSVRFTYEAISNPITRYFAGAQARRVSRLSAVSAFSGETLVGKATLSYTDVSPTMAPRLSSVQVCDGLLNCLPTVSMTYKAPNYGFARGDGTGFAWTLPSGVNTQQEEPPPPPNADPCDPCAYSVATALVDLNGDGLPDVYVTRFGQPAVAYLNTGSGFSQTATSWPMPFGAGAFQKSGLGNQVHIALVDLNGDGLPDVYTASPGSPGQAFLNTGSGFSNTPTTWPLGGGFSYQTIASGNFI